MKKLSIVGDIHIANSISSRKDDYLEACFNKLAQVLNNTDYVIFLGDLFHTPNVSTEILSRTYTLFKQYSNVKIYAIVGNHDSIAMNESSALYKTSLGLLELVGALEILKPNQPIQIGSHLFEAMPLNFKDLHKSESSAIFLGHHFYSQPCSESLTDALLDEYYPNRIATFLGHEHEPHETVNNVYRPGSLLRNAATEYNKRRTPFYYQAALDVPNLEFKPIELICGDGKDLFIDTTVIKSREKFIESLERTIQLCSEKVDVNIRYSLLETLKEIQAPKRVVEYLVKTCNVLGVNIK